MALISLQNISIAFGLQSILDSVTLHIEQRDRVCLLGTNGAGKSTLLKICQGTLLPDSGERIVQSGVRIATLDQTVPQSHDMTINEFVAQGAHSDDLRGRALSQMQLDPEALFGSLSGGQKRRACLARALAAAPDLLLLDEPTNHLDIDTILFLEDFLRRFDGAVLFITHDRSFLRSCANRIVELDRGILSSWECSYEQYLVRKQEMLDSQQKQWENFDKKLAAEEVWIRRGVKARRTRNEGRVRALQSLRQERRERRERPDRVAMTIQDAGASGRMVIDAAQVSFAYDSTPVIRDFTLTVQRGERIGIMGPNGSGKTTLLSLLTGQLAPTSGTVRFGTGLEICYFDQMRAGLDETRTVRESVSPGSDTVEIGDSRRHVTGYLRDFLFPAERLNSPVASLSGGERNRLMLARLFTRPSNVLVFDEPTNDLDIDTLELLEEQLLAYEGTVLLVSHDRTFLDSVVSCTLAVELDGSVREYAGGFDAWLEERRQRERTERENKTVSRQRTPAAPARKRLGYRETIELQELPGRIETLEERKTALEHSMADPAVYGTPGGIARVREELDTLVNELEKVYARWEELEAR